MPVPWQCAGCGALAIHEGRGRTPERCDPCKWQRKLDLQKERRAADRREANANGTGPALLSPALLVPPEDPEPSKVQDAPRALGGVTQPNGFSRRGKIPLDLAGMPDPKEDLPGARIWIMDHKFGIRLHRWQKRDIYRLGGWRRPTQAYWQLGRKNGKSLWACALILTDLVLGHALPNWTFMPAYVVAVSESQTSLASAMGQELKNLIGRSAEADRAFICTAARIEYPHSGSVFELKPNKFGSTQSINPTMAVCDEVHMQKNDQVWNGFVLAGGMPNYMVLGITTPGYDVESFAHALYVRVKAANDEDLVGQIYEPLNLNCESADRAAWAQSNPRLEDDPAFLSVIEKQHRTMPDHEFRRFRLGLWTTTATAWLPFGRWDALAIDRKLTPEDIGADQAVWLGFDGSYSGDSTALYGWTHLAETGKLHGFVAGCWEKPGHTDWQVPRGEVEDVVAAWMGIGRKVILLADPPYWGREIGEWAQRWRNRVIEFPTHSRARMAPACTNFYSAVMSEAFTHDGSARMARHVANVVVKSSPQGDFITKASKTSPAKIDLAVAAVVGHSLASTAQRVRPKAGAG